jgi:hypothetical protein
MRKKLTILLLAPILVIVGVAFKLNAVSAEDAVEKDDIVLTEDPAASVDVDSWPRSEAGAAALKELQEETPGLSQEEYDALINSLPEGAVIVSDVQSTTRCCQRPFKGKTRPFT